MICSFTSVEHRDIVKYGLLDVWNKFLIAFGETMIRTPHILGLTHIRVVGTCSVSDYLRKENFGLPLCLRVSLTSADPHLHITCAPSDLLHFLYIDKQTGSTIAEFSRSREYNPPDSAKKIPIKCLKGSRSKQCKRLMRKVCK